MAVLIMLETNKYIKQAQLTRPTTPWGESNDANESNKKYRFITTWPYVGCFALGGCVTGSITGLFFARSR